MQKLLIRGHYKEYDYEYELYEQRSGKLFLLIQSSFFVEIYNFLAIKIRTNFNSKNSTFVIFEQEFFANDYAMIVFLYDQYIKHHNMAQLDLTFKFKDDDFSAQHFLLGYDKLLSNWTEERINSQNLKKIMPIMIFDKQNYLILSKKFIENSGTVENYKNCLYKYSLMKDSEIELEIKEKPELIKKYRSINNVKYGNLLKKFQETFGDSLTDEELHLQLLKEDIYNYHRKKYIMDLAISKFDKSFDKKTMFFIRVITNNLFEYFKSLKNVKFEIEIPDVDYLTMYFYSIFLINFKETSFIGNKTEKFLNDKILLYSQVYSQSVFQLIENACLHSKGKKAYFYVRTYDHSNKEKYSHVAMFSHIKKFYNFVEDKQSLYHVEVGVIDYSDKGVLAHFNERINSKNIDVTNFSLEDVYSFNNANTYLNEYLSQDEQIVFHYGLKLFAKIMKINNCSYVVQSNSEKYYSVPLKQNENDVKMIVPYNGVGTSYNIILPIPIRIDGLDNSKNNCLTDITEMFDHKYVSNLYDIDIGTINLDEISDQSLNYTTLSQKEELCIQQSDLIYQYFKRNTLHHIKYENINFNNIEILAKALRFALFKYKKDNKNEKIFIVLDINNDLLIHEFIRQFSIFYSRIPENDNFQIAICSKNSEGCYRVNFILSGYGYANVLENARKYLYYNFENTKKYFMNLSYFKPDYIQNDIENNRMFPFDLYLNNILRKGNHRNNLFVSQLNTILDKPLENKEYGCLLDDIHIRLGSKIHIKKFYEAELLFHNLGINYRFAFLLANRIINVIDKSKKIVLVGYENYAETLVLELKKILQLNGVDIYHIIILNSLNINEKIKISNNVKKVLNVTEYSNFEFIYIIPLGSTLSTALKMRSYLIDYIHINFDNKFKNIDLKDKLSYCLILFRDKIYDRKATNIESKYWNFSQSIIKINNSSIMTDFFIQKESLWQDANSCNMCCIHKTNEEIKSTDVISEKVLFHVDKSSTLPNITFIMNQRDKKDLDISNENNDRILKLEGCINYAHINRNDNHYQFYINTCDYFNREEKNIIDWLNNIGKQINFGRENFNIIVSPLHGTNSEFLKAIVDNSFEHNTRFLHFSISDSSREDIRTKFSYITDEYKDMIAIKELANNCDIKIYYVDDIMSTGASITRASSLIRMLLEESNNSHLKNKIFNNNNKIFDGIFLLINRNSYDTINNYVVDPSTQFYSYCNIKVPSIKKYNNKCPNCEMDSKYLNIMASCATLDLRNDFRRLYEKHHLRTNEEYNSWLIKELKNPNSGFFKWKRSWEYMHRKFDEQVTDEEFINEGIQKRNFLRLYCVDKINKVIEKFSTEGLFNRKQIEKKAIKLFINEFYNSCFIEFNYIMLNNKNSNEYSPNDNCSLAIEIIISYIKVISRALISRYHIAKQAILSIMLTLLLAYEISYENCENIEYEILSLCKELVGDDQETVDKLLMIIRLYVCFDCKIISTNNLNKHLLFTDKEICAFPLQQFQLFFTLIRRLSLLESTYVLRLSTIKKYFDNNGIIEQLERKYNDYKEVSNYVKYNEVNFDDLVKKYKNILKWCTTSNAEINRSTFLEKQLLLELKNENKTILNPRLEKLIIESFFENNRIIENAMKYLFKKNKISKISINDIEDYCEIQKPLYELYNIISFYIEKEYIYKMIEKIFNLYNTIKGSTNSNKFKTRIIIKDICKKIQNIADCDIIFAYEFDESCKNIKELMFNANDRVKNENYYDKYKKWSAYNKKVILYEKIPSNLTIIDVDGNLNINELMEKRDTIVKIKIPIEYYNSNENILYYDSTSQTKYIYFILDYENKKHEILEFLFNLKLILSVRGELIDMFSKNVNVLNDANYYLIDNLNPNDNNESNNIADNDESKNIKLLHISDIHYESSLNKKFEAAFEKLTLEMIELKPDLLIVTGDIVNYCLSGQDMLEKYYKVDEIFKKMLIKVYNDEWMDRVIFTPGNHDYAGMNEIIAKSENRELIGAFVPSTIAQSSVGVKYSYYLDFIENYRLSISRKELVKNNLNYLEKRFNQLNLEFLVLDSCFLAAPYRQNKITYDLDNIKEILNEKSNKLNNVKICLAHHSIINKIEYFISRGGEFANCITKIANEIEHDIMKSNDNEKKYNTTIKYAKSVTQYIIKQYKIENLKNIHFEKEIPSFEKIYAEINDKVKDKDVLNFINGIYNISNIELCNTILSDMLAEQADENNKEELIKILEKNDFKLMLSGHRHKYNYGKVDRIEIYETAKFIDLEDNNKINYLLITIDKDKTIKVDKKENTYKLPNNISKI